MIYYSLQDNKSFLFNDQLVVIIYQTSCKKKLIIPHTFIYQKTCSICTTSNVKPNREMVRRVIDLVAVYGTRYWEFKL